MSGVPSGARLPQLRPAAHRRRPLSIRTQAHVKRALNGCQCKCNCNCNCNDSMNSSATHDLPRHAQRRMATLRDNHTPQQKARVIGSRALPQRLRGRRQ